MTISTLTRSLLKNAWFLSKEGFKRGYIFIRGSRVEDAGEQPEPEYELSELVYDFEDSAIIVHGYSLLVDVVEYVIRRISDVDLSIFTKDEKKKLAEVGLVNAYINGITLPVTETSYPEVVLDVARENGMRVGIIAERGTVPRSPFALLLEVDNGWIYFEDSRIGRSSSICTPGSYKSDCLLVDARGYGNITTAIEETYRSNPNALASYKLLTGVYNLCGIDTGFIERGSASDILIYDLKNPLKAAPIRTEQHMFVVLARSQQPDIVIIGGDIFYEHGENLAIPVVKVNEMIQKRLKSL